MPPSKNNNGPMDRLKAEAGSLVGAFADRAMSSVRDRVESTTGRLTDYVEGDGGPGLMAAVTGAKSLAEGKSPARSMMSAGWTGLKEKVSRAFGKGRNKGGKQKLKLTNIVESVDVGVPVRLAYDQWTQYRDFPTFTKKVENAQIQENDDNVQVSWKAQVFWSHREWESTILDQHPDERIIWRSKGQKGHVDGAVTFHELAPNLTRILVVLEYHPQGLFERTANIWRAQGRRARLEIKHFARHVMAHAQLNPDEVEGWRGVIEDGKLIKDHDTALEDEAHEQGEEPASQRDETEAPEDEAAAADREPTDEELPEDELGESGREDEAAEAEEAPADEADEERPAPRRRASARSASRGRSTQRAREGAA